VRNRYEKWAAAVAVFCVAVTAAPAADAAPILEYSQDGKHYTDFDAVIGTAKAGSYYDYYNQSGHPAFGTPKATSSAAMYWDDKRDALSLILISGSATGKDGGQVLYKLSDLPWSTVLTLSDDADEYDYDKGQRVTTPRFNYKSGTDGAIYGGLERSKSWVIKIALSSVKGVKNWRLIDGAAGDDAVDLNMRKTLYIRYAGDDGADGVTPPPPASNPNTTGGNTGGTTGGGGKKVPRTTITRPLALDEDDWINIGPPKILPGSNPGGGGGGGLGNPQPVPEPGTLALLAGGAAALFRRPRRR